MTKEEYKKFLAFFDDKDYYHGGKKSSYSDYSYTPILPALETYLTTMLSFFPDLPKDASVLDIGCAKGFLVKLLQDRGYKACGFDASPYAIEDGRSQFDQLKETVWVGDITDIDEDKPTTYDLINVSETLEHVPEEFTQQALKNIFSLSKRYVLLSLPFDDEPEQLEVETHVNVKNRAYWEKLIEPYATYVVGGNVRVVCWNFFALELKPKENKKTEPVKAEARKQVNNAK